MLIIVKEERMGQWNHTQCFDCFQRERPDIEPVRVKDHEPEVCCFCGRMTIDGIFVRRDPGKMTCTHEESDD